MKLNSKKLKGRTTWVKWAATAALATFLSAEAFGAQAVPSSMSVGVGTYNGGVGALAQTNEGRVVNLYTNNNGNLSVVFKYSASGLSSSLNLAARLRQHTGSDTFTLQSLNSSGAWSNVGSTTGGTTYKNVSIALPSSAIVNGGISIRLISSAGADDLDLDQLIVVDAGGTTTPTSSSTTTTLGQSTTTTLPPPPTTTTTVPVTTSTGAGLPAGTLWYWQLSGTVNTAVGAKVYDIDLYDNSAATISSLKAAGHKVICYFSAGTYENWRPDANQFPAAAIGSTVQGWAGENWLDVRNSTVRSIMAARMDLAKSKGCDGLEPDNVDGYSNKSGFPLTSADQINFNSFLADQAHARGLIVALKNSTDLVSSLVNKFDFAVVEECFKYNECDMYTPFISQNKAVLNAEYSSYSSSICSQAASMKFSTAFYNLNLDGSKYQPCP